MAFRILPVAAAALAVMWMFDGRGPGVSLLGGAFPGSSKGPPLSAG